MVLGVYADFDVRAGGVIEWIPSVRYVGGIRMLFPGVDLERLYYGHLLEMYAKTGGKGLNIQIYYCLPGLSLDNGIKMLHDDDGIRKLYRTFRGKSVVPIYFEEKQGPLLVLDTPGNILEPGETIPSLPSIEIPEIEPANEPEIHETEPDIPETEPDIPLTEADIPETEHDLP
ncbi:hypothetical protein Salat_2855800 [Sesamum alatum]|uniref:PB1-like domain-containing protein n=1 Tax=Sesamum alatum TaxID=300844 RepID=A0AAE1XM79_9LAMI|nr:hypothetical protein Salat_2855800 [Sesamum alatum]